ncbi:FlgO family outer membrane protein [Oceanidesulfovibrio marinus]|uniref:FlgO family outer membrane protein n=1 Tax=Oceanidesulfovibrio marinus TaxID=370038 RepID=UPI00142EDF6E|nr:FlgO family outer membrane protein [Oceanidesulfovibrio marinus]
MRRTTTPAIVLSLLLLLIFAGPAMGARLPRMAQALAEDLNQQMAEKLGQSALGNNGPTLVVTTPVNLNDLETASPLSRLLAEELAMQFTKTGYRVQEIRKGVSVLFKPQTGELMLTRRVFLLGERAVQSALVLIGTYTTTTQNVRFNIRLVHAASNEVLAMSSMSLPLDSEARQLMGDAEMSSNAGIAPTVYTQFTRDAMMAAH